MIENRSSPVALLSRALMRETTRSGTGRSLGAKYSSRVTSVRGQLSKLITRRRLATRSVDLAHPLGLVGASGKRHHHAAVIGDVHHLIDGVGGVDGHRDSADELAQPVEDLGPFGAIARVETHPVALLDTEVHERRGDLHGAGVELAVAGHHPSLAHQHSRGGAVTEGLHTRLHHQADVRRLDRQWL